MNPNKYLDDMARRRGGQAREATPFWLHLLLKPTENEKGTTLVIAILMLALLTYLGIAALNTSTTEIRTSANDKFYKQAFYNADAGISYAVQRGVPFFPVTALGLPLKNLPAAPADLTADIRLQYIDNGGTPRRVEVWSTGTSPGGGSSVIIAGIVGTMTGQQQGTGSGPNY